MQKNNSQFRFIVLEYKLSQALFAENGSLYCKNLMRFPSESNSAGMRKLGDETNNGFYFQ